MSQHLLRLLAQVYAGHSNGVRAVLPIGPKLWSGSSDATVRVWDVGEAQCEHVLQGHTAAVLALAANGPAVLSSSEDHTVRSWSVVTYQCLQTVDMGYRVQGLVRVGGHDVWACGYHPNLQVWQGPGTGKWGWGRVYAYRWKGRDLRGRPSSG